MANKSPPKILILMAAYNGSHWISEQIASIIGQRHVDIDLLVSIDPSEDDTLQIVQGMSKSDSRIKILNSNIKFGSASRNFFHLLANSPLAEHEFIALSDQDDIWLPEKLINSIRSMIKDNAQCFSSNVIAFNDVSKAQQLIVKSAPQTNFDYFFESAGPGCTFVISRYAFAKIKTFLQQQPWITEKVTQHDWLIYAFCRTNDLRWVISSRPDLLYRQHSENAFGANITFSSMICRSKLILNGWYKEQIRYIAMATQNENALKELVRNVLRLRILRTRRSVFGSVVILLLIHVRLI